MKTIVLAAIAVLVGTAPLANAQSAGEQSGAANPPTKCWDVAANQVRTRTEPADTKSQDKLETTVGEGSSEGMSAIAPGSKGTASKNLAGSST